MSVLNVNAIPRSDLMALTREHVSRATDYIAEIVFPELSAPGPDYQWPDLDLDQLLELPDDTLKGQDGKYREIFSKFTWRNEQIEKHGLEIRLDPDVQKRYGSWFDAEEALTMILVDRLRRAHEKAAADLVQGAALSGFDTGVSTEWSTAGSSTPIDDASVARIAVMDQCGMVPDTAIMSFRVREHLNVNQQIRGYLQHTNGIAAEGDITDAAIARALGVERIAVGKSRYNTADQGQTASLSDVWDDEYCTFAVTSQGPSLDTEDGLGFGRTPIWRESVEDLFFVETYDDPKADNSEWIRVKHYAEPKILQARFAHRLSNISV